MCAGVYCERSAQGRERRAIEVSQLGMPAVADLLGPAGVDQQGPTDGDQVELRPRARRRAGAVEEARDVAVEEARDVALVGETSGTRMRPPHLRQTVTSMANTGARRRARAARSGGGRAGGARVVVGEAEGELLAGGGDEGRWEDAEVMAAGEDAEVANHVEARWRDEGAHTLKAGGTELGPRVRVTRGIYLSTKSGLIST